MWPRIFSSFNSSCGLSRAVVMTRWVLAGGCVWQAGHHFTSRERWGSLRSNLCNCWLLHRLRKSTGQPRRTRWCRGLKTLAWPIRFRLRQISCLKRPSWRENGEISGVADGVDPGARFVSRCFVRTAGTFACGNLIRRLVVGVNSIIIFSSIICGRRRKTGHDSQLNAVAQLSSPPQSPPPTPLFLERLDIEELPTGSVPPGWLNVNPLVNKRCGHCLLPVVLVCCLNFRTVNARGSDCCLPFFLGQVVANKIWTRRTASSRSL